MKFPWLAEAEKLIPCRAVVKGQTRDFQLHHLTAADVDEADRLYPMPIMPDEKDAAAVTAFLEQSFNRSAFLAVISLGHENFDSRDINAQIAELKQVFPRESINLIARTAFADSIMTPEMLEAAKDTVNPTGSGE